MIAGVILAAGKGSRIGVPKALLATADVGETFVQHAVRTLQAAGVRPITGVELTLRHGFLDGAVPGPVHLTLLAESSRGYANLCRLITEAHRSSPRDDVALDPSFLEGHTEGVIALSGCRSGEIFLEI
jgi:error-prone DNA polymerase